MFVPAESGGCFIGEISIAENTVFYMREKLIAWGRANFENFPWRTSTNEFHTLIAEILLQRTKASQVVSTYLKFINKYPDPASLARAEVTEVEDLIRPLGLRWRAKLMVQLGKALEQYYDKVPDQQQTLMSLPGVGTYVSAAYLSLHRNRRAPIVDSNIVRFYGRFFGFHTGSETRRNPSVLKLADVTTPKRRFREFNYALIDFTRGVCKPNPEHESCPMKTVCQMWTTQVHDHDSW